MRTVTLPALRTALPADWAALLQLALPASKKTSMSPSEATLPPTLMEVVTPAMISDGMSVTSGGDGGGDGGDGDEGEARGDGE